MPSRPTAYISKITFSSGKTCCFDANDTIVFVGPNNCGKSQLLRDLHYISSTGKYQDALVVSSLEIAKTGNARDLKAYLEANAEHIKEYYRIIGWQVHEAHLRQWETAFLPNNLVNGYMKIISAQERLLICEQQNSISRGEQKTKPQHSLYDSDSAMDRVSDFFKAAFNKDLLIDYRGGKTIPIHIGDKLALEEFSDRVSDEYVAEIRKFPLLDKQGDGMKGYAGILFDALTDNLDITLIDEPEAFLHPPQMRRLGMTLATESNKQIFIATHSSDILRGLLEGSKGNVRVFRLIREGNVNNVHEAAPETIAELWNKPELRYSNALESIFHDEAIVCEDESDCRLLNAACDFIDTQSEGPVKDRAFIPVGGKHGIPHICSILRCTGVPTKSVFDIDLLSEKSLVEKAVIAHGGNWGTIETLWHRVDSAVRSGVKEKTPKEIKLEIEQIIGTSNEGDLPKGDIIEALKQTSQWNIVKKLGKAAIPNGQAQSDFRILIKALSDIGIFTIEIGQIENFCPEIGKHGPAYVNRLLETIPLNDQRLNGLRDFVRSIQEGSHCIISATRID